MKVSENIFPVISFDGMHRSWKWTQIGLLKKYCLEKGIKPYVLRWEYYRFWSWADPIEDPYNEWWQKNKYAECFEEKSQRLNRELHVTLNRVLPNIHKDKNQKILIILDRSIAWKVLMNSTCSDRDRNSNVFLSFKYWVSDTMKKATIIPDCMFILKCSQSELLKRLFASEELEMTHAELLQTYKYDMIQNKYWNFYGWIKYIPESLTKQVHIINADNNPNEIHEWIIQKLEEFNLL